MNQNSNIILSPIFPSSAFRPMNSKQWSSSKNISSIISPIIEKSPLMPHPNIDLHLQNTFLENSMLTTKTKNSFHTKAETSSHNPMNIQFESFSPQEKTIRELNFQPSAFGIHQNFFKIQSPQKQGFEINTFLYKNASDKKQNDVHMSKLNFNTQMQKQSFFGNDSKNKKITNVINNFYIQLPEKNKNAEMRSEEYKIKDNFDKRVIMKKRGRKSLHNSNSKSKKIKKIDKTTFNMNFNQINIKNTCLLKYPIISIPEEDLHVEMYARLFTEENYFKCENTKTYNLIIPTNELSNETFIHYFFDKLHSNSELLLLEENANVSFPYDIIKNYYTKIKKTIIMIQKNFIGKRKSILNKEQCDILYKLIKTMNFISDIICSYSFNNKQLKHEENTVSNIAHPSPMKKNSNKDVYECPFCLLTFDKGQKLGGHMSRNHPNQSEKYKEKMIIRNRRTNNRKLLAVIKEKFLRKYERDISKMDKGEVQTFLKEHKVEYIQFRKQEQKEHKYEIGKEDDIGEDGKNCCSNCKVKEGMEEYKEKGDNKGEYMKRPLFKNLFFPK